MGLTEYITYERQHMANEQLEGLAVLEDVDFTEDDKHIQDLKAKLKAALAAVNENKQRGRDYAELTLQRELFALWRSKVITLSAIDLDALKASALSKLRGKTTRYASAEINLLCKPEVKNGLWFKSKRSKPVEPENQTAY
jgi:hypothetical protein